MGKQEGLNPNIQSIMRLPLETEHGQRRRKCKTNMNKSATRKQSTVSFLCSWHDHQYSSRKMENSKLEVGASVCSQRHLGLYMWQAKRKTKKTPEEAARQLITYPVVVGKSHLPFLPQLPSVMERSHSSGYILSFVMKHVG